MGLLWSTRPLLPHAVVVPTSPAAPVCQDLSGVLAMLAAPHRGITVDIVLEVVVVAEVAVVLVS